MAFFVLQRNLRAPCLCISSAKGLQNFIYKIANWLLSIEFLIRILEIDSIKKELKMKNQCICRKTEIHVKRLKIEDHLQGDAQNMNDQCAYQMHLASDVKNIILWSLKTNLHSNSAHHSGGGDF
jgi:hypothetical protein